jgi:hypothetical protein
VDSAVEAALISGGVGVLGVAGTVAVAIAAARSTRKATSKTVDGATQDTIRALNAARDDRLWEKQAAAYEETLASLLYRLAKRHDVFNPYRMPEDAEQAKQAFAAYDPPDWFGAQARLLAYCPEDIRKAFEASLQADSEVRARSSHWISLTEQARTADERGNLPATNTDSLEEAQEALMSAVQQADARDQELVKLIRDKLRRPPQIE